MRFLSRLTTGPNAILILFLLTLLLARFGSSLALVTLGLMLQRVHLGLALFLIGLGFLGIAPH